MPKKIESAEQIVANILSVFAILYNVFAEKWTFAWIQQSILKYKGKDYDCDKQAELTELVKLIGRNIILTVFQKWNTKQAVFTKKQLFMLASISAGKFTAADFTDDKAIAEMLTSFAKWGDSQFKFSKASDAMPVKERTPRNNGSGKATEVIIRK